jgi:hypothetical protein
MGVSSVSLIKDRHARSIRRELLDLLRAVDNGDIIGLGYAIITDNRSVRSGLAGVMASNRMQAAGVFMQAAVASAFENTESEE